MIHHIRPNPPLVGQHFVYSIPESIKQAKVISFLARLITEVTVANRNIALQVFDREGNQRIESPSATSLVANTSRRFVWGTTGAIVLAAGVTANSEVIPFLDVWVQGGDRLETTGALQNGDQWAIPYLTLDIRDE